ncbi:MAG: hypothetical protein KC910_26225 [Candidatus Eremiobacteraeota bacterium]|nr:hypothetical protein [Candidatus Eremiobacteraeota bacterium]
MEVSNSPYFALAELVHQFQQGHVEVAHYHDALDTATGFLDRWAQGLSRMKVPDSYPDGEVLVEAGRTGLEHLYAAVEMLRRLPDEPGVAEDALAEAEAGHDLLVKLLEVNLEKKEEFAEAVQEARYYGEE